MFERIRFHLTIGYVGIFAFILIVFGVVVVVGFSRQVAAEQDHLLAQQARNRMESSQYASTKEILLTTDGTQIVWIPASADGRLLEGATPTSTLGLPATALAQQAVQKKAMFAATVNGPEGAVRVMSLPVLQGGKVVGVIQAGQSRRVIQETVNRLILVLVPLSVGALALAALGGLFMSRRAMRPVRASFDRQRTFIADASHELKTPLSLIRANADVLDRELKSREERELVEDLVSETDRMSAILSDLLLLARLDAGKLAVAHESFDLSALVVETIQRFRVRAAAQGIEMAVKSSSKLLARGDAERTSQILSTLLDNAMRYTPSGGRITVAVCSHDRWMEVSVADTGVGISPEHLPRVFDRFYRVEVARTRDDGGTGLGLALARELARAQDGELSAKNASTGGAVLRLKLPTA